MRNCLLSVVLWVGTSALAQAQPAPTFAFVYDATEGAQPRLSLQEDACWAFEPPAFTIDAAARNVRIVQRVSPGICGVPPPPSFRSYTVPGSFPIGRYRWEYVQDAIGYTPPLPFVSSFYIRPSAHEQLRFDPVDPVGLEPVRLLVPVLPPCERIQGVFPVQGGFRVVRQVLFGSPQCDVPGTQWLTIGAFAPGTYRIEIGQYGVGNTWSVAEAGTLVVRGSLSLATIESNPQPDVDYSGVWFSPRSAPSTGLTLFHARTPPATPSGTGSDAITAIWYVYDANGDPNWYVIVFEYDNITRTLTGPVLEFDGSNSPPTSSVVGTATIDLGITTGRLRATVGGRVYDVEIERFRWPIRAWPLGSLAAPP